jgi:hypothetical protein
MVKFLMQVEDLAKKLKMEKPHFFLPPSLTFTLLEREKEKAFALVIVCELTACSFSGRILYPQLNFHLPGNLYTETIIYSAALPNRRFMIPFL